jgi:hypothetical protein
MVFNLLAAPRPQCPRCKRSDYGFNTDTLSTHRFPYYILIRFISEASHEHA